MDKQNPTRNFIEANLEKFTMMDLKRLNDVGLMNGPSLVESSKESSDAEPLLVEKIVSFAVIGLGSAGHSRLEAILSDEAERCGFELAGNDDDHNCNDNTDKNVNNKNNNNNNNSMVIFIRVKYRYSQYTLFFYHERRLPP